MSDQEIINTIAGPLSRLADLGQSGVRRVFAALRAAGYAIVPRDEIVAIIDQIPRTAVCGPEAGEALKAIREIVATEEGK